MANLTIQIVENSDRFHVSVNGKPIYTFLFLPKNKVNKAQKQIEAESAAYSYVVANQSATTKFKFLPQAKK